jgi:hypothetical protein
MSFRVTVHHAPTHLLIEASGPAGLADLCGTIDLASGIAARLDYRLAVLDLLGVDIDLGFTDHLQLGTYAAERLRDLDRVASVVPERYRTGTSEKAAQKSGLHFRAFVQRQDAIRWVLEPTITPPAPVHP